MATAQIVNCLVCMQPVRPRQQGVQCDGCYRWSHRICNTDAESTPVEDTSHAETDPSLPDAKSTRLEDTPHAEPDFLEELTDVACPALPKSFLKSFPKPFLKSTLHSVDSLSSRQHCITFDIARYRPKTAPLGATTSIKVMINAMPLCLTCLRETG